jgi:hypothetical protein
LEIRRLHAVSFLGLQKWEPDIYIYWIFTGPSFAVFIAVFITFSAFGFDILLATRYTVQARLALKKRFYRKALQVSQVICSLLMEKKGLRVLYMRK